MVLPHGEGDLYHKYRPRRFNEVHGHKDIVSSIKKALAADSPSQSYLLIGESGTGKTTTARIMALTLNCELIENGNPCLGCNPCKAILSGNCTDLIEVNAADHRGIGDVRQLCQTMNLMPMQLRRKVYILDEAHQLTNDAQSSLLKELEEAPKHVFIILCSTHPTKILKTVKNRCQQFRFGSLRKSEMLNLVEEVATLEGEVLDKKIYEAVVDSASGSPRDALVKLQQVIQLEEKSLPNALRVLSVEDPQEQSVIKICFELTAAKPSWSRICKIYDEVSHTGPPAIGMMLAGYFRNRCLKAKNSTELNNYAGMLGLFLVPFVDGKLGENQLVHALYRAFMKDY